jgi:hypothetical protein
MGKKLTLNVDGLQVASFEVGEAAAKVGTVRAQELSPAGPGPISNTNCFTTPCCPASVTCPTPTSIC